MMLKDIIVFPLVPQISRFIVVWISELRPQPHRDASDPSRLRRLAIDLASSPRPSSVIAAPPLSPSIARNADAAHGIAIDEQAAAGDFSGRAPPLSGLFLFSRATIPAVHI